MERMGWFGILIHFIPLCILLNTITSYSVNAASNPQISASVSNEKILKLIQALGSLPSKGLTQKIIEYNVKSNTNLFGEIILIFSATPHTTDRDEIVTKLANTFCLYSKNLELLHSKQEGSETFNQNESEIKGCIDLCLKKLSLMQKTQEGNDQTKVTDKPTEKISYDDYWDL